MPIRIDVEAIKAELAKGQAIMSGDWKFPDYHRLKLAAGTQYQPVVTKVKLLSWAQDGGMGSLGVPVKIHRNLGPNGKSSLTCPKTENPGTPCPICEAVNNIAQTGNELQRKAALQFAAKDRFLVLCLNITEMEASNWQNRRISVWDTHPATYYQIWTQIANGYGDITAWQGGNLLLLSSFKRGQSQAIITNVSVGPDKPDLRQADWVGLYPNLKEILTPPPLRVLQTMLTKAPSGNVFPANTGSGTATQHGTPPQPSPPVQVIAPPLAQTGGNSSGFTPPVMTKSIQQTIPEVNFQPNMAIPQDVQGTFPSSQVVSPVVSPQPKRSLDDILKPSS